MKTQGVIFKRSKGVYTVEFVLISGVLMLSLFALIEFARVMYMLNVASEVTRRGARIAAVCDMNAGGIRADMRALMPDLADNNIAVDYFPGGCNQGTCQLVTVALQNFTIQTVIGVNVNVPAFSTTLPRESLNSANNAATCA